MSTTLVKRYKKRRVTLSLSLSHTHTHTHTHTQVRIGTRIIFGDMKSRTGDKNGMLESPADGMYSEKNRTKF